MSWPVFLEFLVWPPPWLRRGLGFSAGTLSLSCPLSRDSKAVDVTTESFFPQSHSPSSVLFSLVFTHLQQFVMKGFIFSPWPTLTTCLPVFLLHSETILFYFIFYKGVLLPPIQPQNKYGFGRTSLPCNGWPPIPVTVTSFTCFLPWFLFISLPFPSVGEGTGKLLQYSCLENPMDGGAWWARVHGVTKSRTWLSDFTSLHFPSVGMRVGRTPLTGPCLFDGVLELTGERFWSHMEIPLQNLHWHLSFCCKAKTGFLSTVLISVFSFWSEFGVLCFRCASSNTYSVSWGRQNGKDLIPLQEEISTWSNVLPRKISPV